jgi:cysteine desulfurase
MGLPKADIESTVRISFSEENKMEEVDYALQSFGEIVPLLRRFSRR